MKNRFYQIVRLFLAAALVISSLALAASKTSAADGDLDPTFDTDGRVTTDFNGIGDFGKSIAIQSDGKILVAGSTNVVGSSGFALARYNVDGSLDLSFDVDGKVTTLVAGGLIGANAIAVAPDGKIVVVGVGRPSGGSSISILRQPAITQMARSTPLLTRPA